MGIASSGDVLPAYAGMIPLTVQAHEVDRGAPRVCGDDPRLPLDLHLGRECSPRMRG